MYGLATSVINVGVLLEYGWDERGIDGSATVQNDIYVGIRLALNDSARSALLIGASEGDDFHTKSMLIKVSRRLNDCWTVKIEELMVAGDNSNDPIAVLNKNDRLQFSVQRFF